MEMIKGWHVETWLLRAEAWWNGCLSPWSGTHTHVSSSQNKSAPASCVPGPHGTAGFIPGLFIIGLFRGERWPDLSGGLVWSLCVVFIAWSGSCQSSLYWCSLKSWNSTQAFSYKPNLLTENPMSVFSQGSVPCVSLPFLGAPSPPYWDARCKFHPRSQVQLEHWLFISVPASPLSWGTKINRNPRPEPGGRLFWWPLLAMDVEESHPSPRAPRAVGAASCGHRFQGEEVLPMRKANWLMAFQMEVRSCVVYQCLFLLKSNSPTFVLKISTCCAVIPRGFIASYSTWPFSCWWEFGLPWNKCKASQPEMVGTSISMLVGAENANKWPDIET